MALTTNIALLRAVNVGGRKAIMSDLRAWLAGLGFEDPRSLLQSGNLVFRSHETGAELEALLEREAVAHLGYATDFLVRSADAWRALVAANPMPAMARDDPGHLVVMPLKSAPGPAEMAALRAAIRGPETAEAVGRDLYLAYPDGIGNSKLTIGVIERKLGARGTGRNWNTALKLAAML